MLYLIGIILIGVLIAASLALVSQVKSKEEITTSPPSTTLPENTKTVEVISGFEVKSVELKENLAPPDKERWGFGISLSFTISVANVLFALYQLYADDSDINLYVGGDAYNYIISSNHATGYFILGLIFAISGFTMMIINEIREVKDKL